MPLRNRPFPLNCGNEGSLEDAAMSVMGGLIALVAALVVATAIGLGLKWRAGRFRTVGSAQPLPEGLVAQAVQAPDPEAGGSGAGDPDVVHPGAGGAGAEVLTEADLGAPLGRQATLVQFSTAFCAPCRPTRQILAQVTQLTEGVTHVEIDAATRLDLVRRLRVNSTPTVLVLGPDGVVAKRATGLPRKADVIAALGTVIGLVPKAPETSEAPKAPKGSRISTSAGGE
jgi:thiol-disulfide isomerase/thioredoxin